MPRRRPGHHRTHPVMHEDCADLIRYWLAQLLSFPAVWRQGYNASIGEFEHPEVLSSFVIEPDEELDYHYPPEALAEFVESHELAALLANDPVYQNLNRVGNRLTLPEADKRLLTFACYLESHEWLSQVGELVREPTYRRLVNYLSAVLEIPTNAINKAFQSDSVLRASNMFKVNMAGPFGRCDLTNILLVDNQLLEILRLPVAKDEELTRLFFQPAPDPSLNEDDFADMADELALLKQLLRHAVSHKQQGVNLLLYGPPGTGKTQLALVLAQALNYSMVTVPETDNEGDAIHEARRIGCYAGCQRILQEQDDTLVLFDEAEGCLCDEPMPLFLPGRRQTPKPAVIDILDRNATPAIWISNHADMDPAFMRRFTHVVKLAMPCRAQRDRLIRQTLKDEPVSEQFLQAAAELESLSPALLRAAIDFAHMAGDGEHVESLLTRNINARLEAQEATQRLKVSCSHDLPWRADCLCASEDVADLLDDIQPNVPVRFCLYGPPGTGKTAWAHQLAERLGQPAKVRQASDLLGMYVGQTEKAIAALFAQAERDNAVLVIDEADSFIGSRQHAHRNWEVSHVNQFLASMERYQGVFIATTNLLDRVDEAAMRRFDFTIAFDYLDVSGATALFSALADTNDIPSPDSSFISERLASMTQLTPGDFAAVNRRLRVRKTKPTAKQAITFLEATQKHKTQPSRPIGFNAQLVSSRTG